MHISDKIKNLAPYAFAEVDKLVAELNNPIDFGVGDPIDPTPDFIIESLTPAAKKHATSGYPSYIGSKPFREACANWMKNRFQVDLDPETEITSHIGSKEAIFNFPEAIINPGDYVLCPSPGYPPYKQGTRFAEGIPYFYPLLSENNFHPDLDQIPEEIAKKAKIMWICYPNSPTGKTATAEDFKKIYIFCQKHDIIMASDEPYSEIYFDKPTISALSVAKKGVVVFQSLSKRSRMTGYRVGFVAGDPEIIATFRKLKTNIDSGTPNFVQEAAITALADESHVEQARSEYAEKLEIMRTALAKLGLKSFTTEGTFYIWQEVPEGDTSLTFAKKLLDPEIAIIVTPGEWISDECDYKGQKINPGKQFVRFALVPTVEQVKEAARRLEKLNL